MRDCQTLLIIEKKTSLTKSQELDDSKKKIIELKRKLNFTSTFSQGVCIAYTHIIPPLLLFAIDVDDKKMIRMKKYYQEIEPLELESCKPVDEDIPKPDTSTHDKTLILIEG